MLGDQVHFIMYLVYGQLIVSYINVLLKFLIVIYLGAL